MKRTRGWITAIAAVGLMAMPAMAKQAKDITLTGVIRDFKITHPDFEAFPDAYGKGLVNVDLGEDGKPVLSPKAYNKKAKEYQLGGKKAVTSPETFAQWFTDVPGVNKRIEHSITLKPVAGKPGVYGFKREKPDYFFPIDDKGWGLSGSKTDPETNNKKLKWASKNVHNFHFTYELRTRFTFTPRNERDKDLVFEFTGDDDVWVFINGKLAVDLGGVHGQQQASVNLDHKAIELGLEQGEAYELVLFFAERHTSESNFRIETTLELESVIAPTYD